MTEILFGNSTLYGRMHKLINTIVSHYVTDFQDSMGDDQFGNIGVYYDRVLGKKVLYEGTARTHQ